MQIFSLRSKTHGRWNIHNLLERKELDLVSQLFHCVCCL